MSVLVPQDIDWKERAQKWEKEAQRWTDEAQRLKGEVEDWRNKFETLLEASLLQINRMAEDLNSSPRLSPVPCTTASLPIAALPSTADDNSHSDKEFKKTPSKKGKGFFGPLFPRSDEKTKKKDKSKDKDKDKKNTSILDLGIFQDEPTGDFLHPLSPSTSYQHLPRLQVNPLTNKHRTLLLTGPEPDRSEAAFLDVVAGKSVSTYPFIPGNPTRDGDPLCDRFSVQIYENRLIACVADGCNWGEKPRAAAHKASATFVDYVNANQDSIVDVKKAGVVLLSAFECAHNSIMEGKEAFWEAGTTTLLGGVLLEINKGNDKFTPQWEFVCASVGDCKAFCYTNGEVTDITHGNRQNTSDPRDCGGRLGPHLDEGKPDLRNLNLFCASCEEGDIIFLVTDGVHDNLDPQHLGKLPRDMPKEYNLYADRWDDVDTTKATSAKNAYTTQLLLNVLDETTQPKIVTDKLIEHCVNVTKKSRDYMESNNGKRLPEDYIEFPGKMDHTTCLCFRVGRFSPPQGTPSPSSSPSSSPTNGTQNGTSTPLQKDNWTKISPSPSVMH